MAKILIADDEPNILMLTSVMFRDMGLEVISATNGEDAIQKAIEEKPDIIITDVIMPFMGGRESAERAIHKYKNSKVLFMSGYTEEMVKLQGVGENLQNYLQKPFLPGELLKRVREILTRENGAQGSF